MSQLEHSLTFISPSNIILASDFEDFLLDNLSNQLGRHNLTRGRNPATRECGHVIKTVFYDDLGRDPFNSGRVEVRIS